MTNPTVDILLPTYNGAPYLHEQLKSLCRQTFTAFTLITRDDGSRDDSIVIVNSFSDRLTIRRIENPENRNIGAVKSFELLMHESNAGIVLFCDQDDIWDETRVESGVAALTDATRLNNKLPVAVFSDLTLLSNDHNTLQGSFLAHAGFNPAVLRDPYYIAFRNPAPGCSMTVNRALIDAALPFNADTVLMHDWWLMLTASLRGTVVFIDKPLLRYRLHAGNTLGMAHDRPLNPVLSILSMISPRKLQSVFSKINVNTRQARDVFTRCGSHFSIRFFWVKFIAGRYLFPILAGHISKLRRYSWKRVGEVPKKRHTEPQR